MTMTNVPPDHPGLRAPTTLHHQVRMQEPKLKTQILSTEHRVVDVTAVAESADVKPARQAGHHPRPQVRDSPKFSRPPRLVERKKG